MAKPEWGNKQTCPKCGTRFYDLGKTPLVCVSCDTEFTVEPILKSKQPIPVSDRKPVKEVEKVDDEAEVEDEDIEVEDDDDDPIADISLDDDDADLDDIVDTKLEDKDE